MKYLDLAEKLIGFKSISGNFKECNKALDFIKNYLNEFTVHEFESHGYKSLLVTNQNGKFTNKQTLILNAHIDVVFGHEKLFIPKINGNRLYGRGSFDMKGAAAVEIEVFKNFANKVDYPLALQIVTDEEIGGYNGTGYQLRSGVKSDFAIVGESQTNFNIKNKAKGILWIQLSVKGRSAHAAYPWNGINAISKCLELVRKLEKKYKNPTSDQWTSTINIASIETTNETMNKIPSDCSVKIDLRYIPEDKSILNEIKALITNENELKVLNHAPVHSADADCTQIKKLQKICKSFNIESSLIGGHGASDMRFYSERKMNAVEFGPIGSGDHSDLEWVDTDSLKKFYNILTSFVTQLRHSSS